MTKTAFLLALILTALASVPAHAQRVFVSGTGVDTNPCTATQPCRSFQQAYNTVAANGEIDVLDPAGYGPLTITHGISIQAHGFGGITQTGSCDDCAAVTIVVSTGDPVTLNGLLLEGAGTGTWGILIGSGPSVQILNTVVRHFVIGISDHSTTNGSNLLIEDTVTSDNTVGIEFAPDIAANGSVKATLNRITANHNSDGVAIGNATNATITSSVISNVATGNGVDCGTGCLVWLSETVISGNAAGIAVEGTVRSYGDNYINDNTIPVNGGSLTPVSTQ
jgi:hypothetical protein